MEDFKSNLNERYTVLGGKLEATAADSAGPVHPLATLIHDQFRAMALSNSFPCLGCAGIVRRGDYQFGLYNELGSAEAVDACARHLAVHATDFPRQDSIYAGYIAVFCGEIHQTEEEFESALFQQLLGMHELDRMISNRPDQDVRARLSTPQDEIAFVFAGADYFVVGFHPASSRWSRRFSWATLVFNDLSFVKPLRSNGKLAVLREKILARDRRLQGSDNPVLDGDSEAAKFSGRTVESHWKCPVNISGLT
jgi:FPC/CPF motif-containing protein YcgG